MKKLLILIAAALVCVAASAQNKSLEQKARGDAQKVEKAAGLTPAQGKQIYQFQLERYTSNDSLKKLSLDEPTLKKKMGEVNALYQKRAEGVMNAEQLAAFRAWKAEKAQKNQKNQNNQNKKK